MAKSLIYVKIQGTGIFEKFAARSHGFVANPASTYHRFILEDGTEFLINDFGIRSVTIADSPEALG